MSGFRLNLRVSLESEEKKNYFQTNFYIEMNELN